MTQREFNQLMAFQPSKWHGQSLRELVEEFFVNEFGDANEVISKGYLEEIRAQFVTDDPVTRR